MSLLTTLVGLATGDAVDRVERRLIWFATSGLFFVAATLFLLYAAFAALEPGFGPIASATLLAIGCAAFGGVAMAIPRMLDRTDAEPNLEDVVEVAEEKADELADLIGPMQVAASAFMVGLNAGRRARGG